jgi:AbrB family looped-hinge helix DNA binding protein
MAKRPFKTKPVVVIKQKMQVTIPKKIVRMLKLDVGSFLELSIVEDRILLEPIHLAGDDPGFETSFLTSLTRRRR